MIRAAYLRVYVPRDRLERWDVYMPPPSVRRVARVSDHFMWEESTRDDAFTREWDGTVYVCPRYPRLRMLEGVLAFRNAYGGFAETLIPDRALRTVRSELAEIIERQPDARSYILSAPWHVPIRWFIAFDPAAREVHGKDGDLTIRYGNKVGDAAERVVRAVGVLEEAGFDDSILDPVTELADWLGEFDDDCMLELDYGSVAGLFSDVDLAMDESAAEIQSSLAALQDGNMRQAGMLYAHVAGRWAPAQAINYVN